MTFVCQGCDADISSNDLVKYFSMNYKKMRYVCPDCYYIDTNWRYKERSVDLDKKWQSYINYMKKRKRLVTQNFSLDMFSVTKQEQGFQHLETDRNH